MAENNGNTVSPKVLDQLNEALMSELNVAKGLSNDLYSKICRLNNFSLLCDEEKDASVPAGSNGLLSDLGSLIDSLRQVNKRNTEILQQLDSII